jgi:hypothetical protein
MEATAVHALEQDYVPTGIHDRAGDRDPGLAGHVDDRHHHLFRALMGETLTLGDVHCAIQLRGMRGIVLQPVVAINDRLTT